MKTNRQRTFFQKEIKKSKERGNQKKKRSWSKGRIKKERVHSEKEAEEAIVDKRREAHDKRERARKAKMDHKKVAQKREQTNKINQPYTAVPSVYLSGNAASKGGETRRDKNRKKENKM